MIIGLEPLFVSTYHCCGMRGIWNAGWRDGVMESGDHRRVLIDRECRESVLPQCKLDDDARDGSRMCG